VEQIQVQWDNPEQLGIPILEEDREMQKDILDLRLEKQDKEMQMGILELGGNPVQVDILEFDPLVVDNLELDPLVVDNLELDPLADNLVQEDTVQDCPEAKIQCWVVVIGRMD